MQKTQTSIQSLTNPHYQRQLLEWVEYASLVGSAVGTLVAAASEQVIFAAAPLTLAVSLNFLNRSRIAQKPDLPKISHVKSTTQSLDEIFPFLPPAELFDPTGIEQEIAELRRSLNSLSSNTASAIEEIRQHLATPRSPLVPTELNSIQEVLRELSLTTDRLDKTALREQDWETVNVQILLVKEAIADLQQRSGPSKMDIAIAALQADLQKGLPQLLGRVEVLEQKNREIVKPYLKRLIADVKQLHSAIAPR